MSLKTTNVALPTMVLLFIENVGKEQYCMILMALFSYLPDSNVICHDVEFEAVIVGLISALQMRIRMLDVYGYSGS